MLCILTFFSGCFGVFYGSLVPVRLMGVHNSHRNTSSIFPVSYHLTVLTRQGHSVSTESHSDRAGIEVPMPSTFVIQCTVTRSGPQKQINKTVLCTD